MSRVTLHKNPKLVFVKWIDASGESKWTDFDNEYDVERAVGVIEVKTLGFLIAETKYSITVALSFNTDGFVMNVNIPKTCVLAYREVESMTDDLMEDESLFDVYAMRVKEMIGEEEELVFGEDEDEEEDEEDDELEEVELDFGNDDEDEEEEEPEPKKKVKKKRKKESEETDE